jgi:hypothetical protein
LTITATGIAGGMEGPPAVTITVVIPDIDSNGSPPDVQNL